MEKAGWVPDMIRVSRVLNWFTSNETSTNLRQEADVVEDEWYIISSEKTSLSKPLLDAITDYLPKVNSSHFTECLGQFYEMVLVRPLQNSDFSKTLLVAIKNQAQEVHTFALRILNSDKTKGPQLADRYIYLREGMIGAEWDRFLNDERLIYAIGRDTRESTYCLLSRYDLQKLPYKGPEYKLFATFALYEENDDSFETPCLTRKTAKALESYLPHSEPELFSYCLASGFPKLQVEGFLGKGKTSTVFLATYGNSPNHRVQIALRISDIDRLPNPKHLHQALFKIGPDHWGSEFNAFIINTDPHMIDTHYAICWSNEGRFVILDKYALQKEKVSRSGNTYTLYATIGPYIQKSQTLTQFLQEKPEISPSLFKKFATQLLLAVACLPKGVSHRDIKPDNILVAKDSTSQDITLKLLDFGISSVDSKRAADMCGTPLTMAPELLSGLDFDLEKADVFSVYAILHLMATGSYPFGARGVQEWQQKIHMHVSRNIAPKETLKNISFLDKFDTVVEKESFLNFMNRIGYPDPTQRLTSSQALEDCFLYSDKGAQEEKPPKLLELPLRPPPASKKQEKKSPQSPEDFQRKRLFIQLVVGAGILCIIHNIAKRSLQKYFDKNYSLPRLKERLRKPVKSYFSEKIN